MCKSTTCHSIRAVMIAIVVWSTSIGLATGQRKDERSWSTEFGVDKRDLSPTGRNLYFVLEPRYTLVLTSGRERLVITVLDELKTVDAVETRVIEERETRDGQLVEVSRNCFAISKRDQSVYYFGEDVDMYERGKVVSHSGAWLAGINGARFGLMMPGQISVKARFYQEIAPEVAMDRAQILSTSERVKTPAGDFRNCLKMEETTPLEPGKKEYKYYAPGIGLIRDGDLTLEKYGKLDRLAN